MRTTHTIAVSFCALGLVATAWTPPIAQSQDQQGQAQQQRANEPRGEIVDNALENRIVRRLAERLYVGQNFAITAQQGTVTISGTVPSENDKQRALRIVRKTQGVNEVKDQLRVDRGVAQASRMSAVDEAVLSRRVAEKIAASIPGAKAGEDWWLTGWRVEGPNNDWNLVVQTESSNVTLEGELRRERILRKAVDAALQVHGVMSVRSNVELPPLRGYPYRGYYPYADYPFGYYTYAPYAYPFASPSFD